MLLKLGIAESPRKTLAKITEAKALKEFTADLRLLDLLNVFRKEIVTLMANEHVEISLENSDSPLFSRKSLELSFYVSNGSQTNNASNENNHKEKPLDGLHENHIAKIKTADVATKKFLFKFLRERIQQHVDNLVEDLDDKKRISLAMRQIDMAEHNAEYQALLNLAA